MNSYRRTWSRAGTAAAALAAAGALLGGCSQSQSVDRSQVEQQVNKQLTAKVGKPLEKVSCPDDLEGKVGASERCTISAEGKRYGTTVKVTGVQGDHVKFHIQVDQHAMN